MRKFCVRWWVENPRARFEAEAGSTFDLSRGLSIRFRREASPEDAVHYLVSLWVMEKMDSQHERSSRNLLLVDP